MAGGCPGRSGWAPVPPKARGRVSTPESGVDSIAITWALLDPVMTISNSHSAPVVSVAVQGNVVPSSWFGGSSHVALVMLSAVSGKRAARSSSFCSMNSSASLRKSAAVVKHPATPPAMATNAAVVTSDRFDQCLPR